MPYLWIPTAATFQEQEMFQQESKVLKMSFLFPNVAGGI